MARSKTAFLSGTVTDNPLTNVATTLNSAELASLPAIAAPDIAVIVLDPAGGDGAPEVVYVTAHTGAATSATIVRAREGSSAREHVATTPWVHGPTIVDIDESPIAFLERLLSGDTLYRQVGWLGPCPGGVFSLGTDNVPIGLGWYLDFNDGTIGGSSSGGRWLVTGGATNPVRILGARLDLTADPTFICRADITSQATQEVILGFISGSSSDVTNPQNGIYFRVNTTGNIIGVSDNGGTQTTRDSGSAPTGTIQEFKIVITSGGTVVQFFIDGSQVGANVTTNIPSNVLAPCLAISGSGLSMEIEDAVYFVER